MSTTSPLTRCIGLVAATLTVVLLVVGGAADPASAAPGEDPDGSTASLQEQLNVAARGYVEAKARLDGSQQRQLQLRIQMASAEQRLKQLEEEVGWVAAAAYRGSRMTATMALLRTGSPSGLLHGAATVQYLALQDDRELHELAVARRAYAQQQDQLTAEIKLAQQQVAEMQKRKADAERALGRSTTTAGFTGGRPTATQAPRNPDGSWPSESCSVDDPTTSGCLTPRTLHALQQARAAGFTRYTACYRSGGSGEHPKGRACDFSATTSGFVNARASGSDKTYGDNLAAWFRVNTDRIAVLYVIWYKQIWFPGLGWRSYSGDGTPAGDHYNHVHLSVY